MSSVRARPCPLTEIPAKPADRQRVADEKVGSAHPNAQLVAERTDWWQIDARAFAADGRSYDLVSTHLYTLTASQRRAMFLAQDLLPGLPARHTPGRRPEPCLAGA